MLSLALAALVVATPADTAFTPEQVAFYETAVRPVLTQHCLKCHGADEKKVRGGLKLNTRAAVLKGGDSGPAADIVKPELSLMLLAVLNKRPDGGEVMPPTGAIPKKDIETLAKWVAAGLPVPAKLLADDGDGAAVHPEEKGGVVTPESKNYWAYRPLVRPAVPATKSPARTPIDAFIQAKLDGKNLAPVGPAAKRALARRAYYDLTGLPPTPEQLNTFERDASPAAFEKLVDDLLASPHYGEKWGRHWLDVVRFAETNGYERDSVKPFAWKYRDYVIRSFNADVPYDRFVKEQIAGDELYPTDPAAVTATGFFRLGVWDDEPADHAQALFDGYDDHVSVVGQGFLGMTLNCARCHDHKKDPIPQADYYRLLAFFRDVKPHSYDMHSGSSPSITDVSPPERRKVYEAELKARQAEMAKIAKQLVTIEDEAIKALPAEDQRASEGVDRPKVVAKVVPLLKGDEKAAYAKLKKDKQALERKPTPAQDLALSVNNGTARPAETHIMARGNPHAVTSAKTLVTPGFPQVLGFPEPKIPAAPAGAKSSGRRTVLANWLADKANPVPARVMANRLWQHHFGKGLCGSPNDFGKLGETPTHPELLDWLAAEFQAGDWKIKRMHKLLMLTDAYQRSASAEPAALKTDPANALYWRFPARRLTAEEVRDSILVAGGKLNRELYGPSVFPKISKEVLAGQSVPGQGWNADKGGGYDPKKPDAGNRRSVYAFVKRSLQVPILISHDQADTDSSCPVRYTTTVPTQALGMLNGDFTNEMAAALASRLKQEFPSDVSKQLARGIRLATGRDPTADELAKDAAFVTELHDKFGLTPDAALTRFALLLLNANEFVYLD